MQRPSVRWTIFQSSQLPRRLKQPAHGMLYRFVDGAAIQKNTAHPLLILSERSQPSMDSRRQCRAVKIINTNAMPKDAAADTHTSSTMMGSSLSTLVISKC